MRGVSKHKSARKRVTMLHHSSDHPFSSAIASRRRGLYNAFTSKLVFATLPFTASTKGKGKWIKARYRRANPNVSAPPPPHRFFTLLIGPFAEDDRLSGLEAGCFVMARGLLCSFFLLHFLLLRACFFRGLECFAAKCFSL